MKTNPENTLNPSELFCPNLDCPSRGQVGEGNIHVHSMVERRCVCDVCEQTFATTKGTLFYRLRTDPKVVICVLILLAHQCPREAIVKAYGLDKRTIEKWWKRAGTHCEQVHMQKMDGVQLDIEHAQLDEIKVKMWGRSVWMGLCMMVSTRLWLGGVVSEKRDKEMIEQLVMQVKKVALCRSLLLAVDGLPHYKTAIKRVFRSPLPTKQGGRPRLIPWSGVIIGRVIKRRNGKSITIERQIVADSPALIVTENHTPLSSLERLPLKKRVAQLIKQTQGKTGVLNTAFIERLNGTFRQRLSCLSRRTRHLAHQLETVQSGMFIVGCFYNFCIPHHSLRCKLFLNHHDGYPYRWVSRTPAMAAGLTDHIWSPSELLFMRIPPPRWTPPKKRGRRSQAEKQVIERWA